MIWSAAAEIWMKTTWFGFSTALQTFIQRYFSMQMLTLHCDLYEWRRVRSAHTKLLLDISGDLRRCVGSQISAIASIFPIELTRSSKQQRQDSWKPLLSSLIAVMMAEPAAAADGREIICKDYQFSSWGFRWAILYNIKIWILNHGIFHGRVNWTSVEYSTLA